MNEMENQQEALEEVMQLDVAVVEETLLAVAVAEETPAETTEPTSAASTVVEPLIMNLGGETGAVVHAKTQLHPHDVVFHLTSKDIAYGCFTNGVLADPVAEPLPDLGPDFVIPSVYRFEVTGEASDAMYARTIQSPFGIVFFFNAKDVQYACFTEGRLAQSQQAAATPAEEAPAEAVPAEYAGLLAEELPGMPAVEEILAV
jgi:hypothetical protein